MKQKFVPYNIGVKLREKGFNEPCFGFFNEKHEFQGFVDCWNYNTNSDFKMFPTAPLYQDVVDWFREKHKIIIDVRTMWINKAIGLSEIDSFVPHCNHDIDEEYKDYYEAFNRAIERAIELI